MAIIHLKKVKTYSSFLEKVKGLIGEKEPIETGSGIALPGVNSVHTFFVGYPIDLVFLDSENRILKFAEKLPRFSFSPLVWSAKTTLELKQGSIRKLGLKIGDEIDF